MQLFLLADYYPDFLANSKEVVVAKSDANVLKKFREVSQNFLAGTKRPENRAIAPLIRIIGYAIVAAWHYLCIPQYVYVIHGQGTNEDAFRDKDPGNLEQVGAECGAIIDVITGVTG